MRTSVVAAAVVLLSVAFAHAQGVRSPHSGENRQIERCFWVNGRLVVGERQNLG